jgi:hypothetical protein
VPGVLPFVFCLLLSKNQQEYWNYITVVLINVHRHNMAFCTKVQHQTQQQQFSTPLSLYNGTKEEDYDIIDDEDDVEVTANIMDFEDVDADEVVDYNHFWDANNSNLDGNNSNNTNPNIHIETPLKDRSVAHPSGVRQKTTNNSNGTLVPSTNRLQDNHARQAKYISVQSPGLVSPAFPLQTRTSNNSSSSSPPGSPVSFGSISNLVCARAPSCVVIRYWCHCLKYFPDHRYIFRVIG